MEGLDLIFGIHSIIEALKNPSRQNYKIVCTKEGFEELKKQGKFPKDFLQKIETEMVSNHQLQEKAKTICKDINFKYKRVPSNIFLVVDSIPISSVDSVYQNLKSGKAKKIICLDRITDVYNGAAILRTASFYGVDFLVFPIKGRFGLDPSFFRIASGATEHVELVQCPNLSKFIKKLQTLNVHCVGLSEHAEMTIDQKISEIKENESICLVFGAEDKGLSNAVSMTLPDQVALKPIGAIKSLNVSVASAVAMTNFFG